MNSKIPSLALNDGRPIPQIGIGTWQIEEADATTAVAEALAAGYRLIDTAAVYENEAEVGEGIRAAGLPRQEIFVTTKLWNDHQGYEPTLQACRESLQKLGLDYVDLYLIHWPMPSLDKFVETWRAFSQLREEGSTKSIGVSNFTAAHLQRLFDATGIVPAVNQIELHPQFNQSALRAFHTQHGIVTESWSPLAQGELLKSSEVAAIAAAHGKTPAQAILRWHLQHGLVVIPKSSTPARIHENFALFNFELTPAEMAAFDAMDIAKRLGPDPDNFAAT